MTDPRRPFVIEVEDGAADPAQAPPVPDLPGAAGAEGRAVRSVAALAVRRGSALGRLATWAFAALFALVLSVAAWDFVTGLFTRNTALGWLAFALVALAVLAAALLALREALAFARLARLDGLRTRAEAAHAGADLKAARAVVAEMRALYARRAEAAWGLRRLDERAAEVMDADALLALAETEVLAPLDALARAEVEAAAARVAAVTAIVPMALADVAAALYSNLRMIRRLAEIYGGRAGAFGSWRLLRRVMTALLATGALALADDLVGSVAGGGMLSKLSRRFGEGVVNGALTARIGIAAMEACRPLPFRALDRPGVSALMAGALKGLVPKGAAAD